MQNSDAQKSEVHEVTDDASSSPASNQRQHASNPPGEQSRTNVPGVAPASNFERGAAERTRTNVAGVGPAEADDLSNAPPGHLELEADLDTDRPFYPTAGVGAGDGNSGGGAGAGVPGGGTDMRIGDDIKEGDKNEDRDKLFPGYAKPPESDQSRQNLSP